MSKKEHLISSLRVAINALHNDTIFYSWNNPNSCNMGVVAQAVLKVDAKTLGVMRKELFAATTDLSEKSWRNAVKHGCPITGVEIPVIIKQLEDAGLSREDIVHLEYLSNPAILSESGIPMEPVYKQVKTGTKKTETKEKILGGLFGNRTIIKEEPVYEQVADGYAYRKNYHKDRGNLIKYLSAWVRILTNEAKPDEATNLEAELLNAVADENYELAASLRDKITNR